MFGNLPERFRPNIQLPKEIRATCDSCVMARPDWPTDARDSGPFLPDLKCCTFAPFLPNFTLGRLIIEGGHEESLKRALLRGQVTPLGLLPNGSTFLEFGRRQESKCSFLTRDGECSIWRHRPSVCRSYFCVSSAGEEGQAAWRRAETAGNEAEWTLAHEVLWDLGFTQDEVAFHDWAEWKDRQYELWVETAKRAFGDFFNQP